MTRAARKIKIPKDNPKWDQIAKMLKRALMSGKTNGIFKTEEPELLPFYKKPYILNGKCYKIETELIEQLQNRPEATIAESPNPFYEYKKRKLLPLKVKDKFAPKFIVNEDGEKVRVKPKTMTLTPIVMAQERDRMYCALFNQILDEFRQRYLQIHLLTENEQQEMVQTREFFNKLLPFMNSKLPAGSTDSFDHYLEDLPTDFKPPVPAEKITRIDTTNIDLSPIRDFEPEKTFYVTALKETLDIPIVNQDRTKFPALGSNRRVSEFQVGGSDLTPSRRNS